MKRVIVEGPDGAGKTTLVRLLRDEFFLPVVVNTLGPEQDFDEWWPMTITAMGDKSVLHDRFFYSELVYGPTLRGYVNANETTIEWTQAFLRQIGFLIYARPSMDTLQRSVRVEDQMKGVAEKFTELVEAYDRLMVRENLVYGNRFYLYNWEGSYEPRQVVEKVRGYLTGDVL